MVAADPDDRPRRSGGWVGRYGLAYLGINLAWAAPSQLLVALQLLDWSPDVKEARLAVIMGVGGFVSLVSTPLAGVLSDRTTSRFGRRRPWILLGTLVSAAALVVMAYAPGYAVLLAAWLVFQFFIAFAVTSSLAVAPDQVPRRQYGLVSGVLGLTYTMGLVLGTVLGDLLAVRTAYLVTAGLTVALVLPFLMALDDPRVVAAELPGAGGRAESWVPSPRKHPDYAWVWVTRLLVTLGNTVALFYLLYFLRDEVGLADPEGGVLTLTVIYAGTVVVASVVSGRWSDRVDRRLPFVSGASLGVAAACLIMACAREWPVIVMAAVVLGLSWGVYMAVDQALINEVLPTAAHRGRDMSVMHLAVVLPNALSPVVAAVALLRLGGYPGLYLLAGGLCVVGAVLVHRVRGVR
ncbi:MFS transporter [Ornithinimicrobium avium]|uniref:MFS transporter n=1 Tax=Ornithinimicrobium avium TaxID=2283195 RepID=A0A345NT30_9MICO|nr:MFS transporter [Ornithinimicrobium avium]